LQIFLSDIATIDDDYHFSGGMISPKIPEIFEHVFHLSLEDLNAMDSEEEMKEEVAPAPSLPILDPSTLSAAQLEIGQAQRADHDLAPLIDYAHTQVNPFKRETRRDIFHSLARHYFLRDGVLYRYVKKQKDKAKHECIVIPSDFRNKLLTHFHEDVNGHLGFRKLFHKLSSRFFWENMHKDI
jgi:hypothetical protein